MEHDNLDDELRELGEIALRDTFYREYSMLVARYLQAANGLGIDDLRGRLAETSSPFGCLEMDVDVPMLIQVVKDGEASVCQTMAEALKAKGDEIRVAGVAAFEWRDSVGWYVVQAPTSASRPRTRQRR